MTFVFLYFRFGNVALFWDVYYIQCMQPLLVEQFKALKAKQPIGLGLLPSNLRATRFLTEYFFPFLGRGWDTL